MAIYLLQRCLSSIEHWDNSRATLFKLQAAIQCIGPYFPESDSSLSGYGISPGDEAVFTGTKHVISRILSPNISQYLRALLVVPGHCPSKCGLRLRVFRAGRSPLGRLSPRATVILTITITQCIGEHVVTTYPSFLGLRCKRSWQSFSAILTSTIVIQR